MTPIFEGQVNGDGKLLVDKGEKLKQYLAGLNGKRVQVMVEKIKHSRTNGQNRYYHGVVVKLIAQHTGHDPEMIHELLKQMFSPKWHYPNGGSLKTLAFQPPPPAWTLWNLSRTPRSAECGLTNSWGSVFRCQGRLLFRALEDASVPHFCIAFLFYNN
jgi:hypothetical protein